MPTFSHKGILFFVFIIVIVATSCSPTKTITLETLRHDTLYINTEKYDSIYINRTSDIDRTRDTITITKTLTEYRYHLLRDTIYKTRTDSIPYEVQIVTVKEVPRPRNLFDYISYICFGIILGLIVLKFKSKALAFC